MLPIQIGTGDPSPENVRPIYGHTSATAHRIGKNLISYPYYSNDGTYGGVSFSTDAQGKVTANGSAGAVNFYLEREPGYRLPAGTYTATIYGTFSGCFFYVRYNLTPINYVRASSPGSYTFTLESDTELRVYINHPEGVSDISIDAYFQIESGSTATDYEPYQGDTYTVQFGQTVYGGTLDFVTGVLTATWGYIASYNGETLPAEWISDRDVYAAGATPTTGAEVAYKLATPQTYQLTPQEITTLYGTNNIWVTTNTNQP